MKIQRRLPKSMRKNPVERAMPRWTSEPESTEWFDTFNLDGEELIGFVAEPQQPKEEDRRKKEEKKRQEKKASKGEKQETPTEKGFVVVDGKQHVIAVGAPASYRVLVEEEFQAHAPRDGEQAHKRQQKADESRAQHLKMAAEQMRAAFVASTGELLIAELVVGGPGNAKDALIKLLPQALAKVASSTATSQAGKAGLWELAQGLLAQEHKQERERLGLKPKKYKPGMQVPAAQSQKGAKHQSAGKHQKADKQQQVAKHQEADKHLSADKHQKADKYQIADKHQSADKHQKADKHQSADKHQKADKHQRGGKHQRHGKHEEDSEPEDCAKHQPASKQPAKHKKEQCKKGKKRCN